MNKCPICDRGESKILPLCLDGTGHRFDCGSQFSPFMKPLTVSDRCKEEGHRLMSEHLAVVVKILTNFSHGGRNMDRCGACRGVGYVDAPKVDA